MLSRDRDDEKEREINSALKIREEKSLSRKEKDEKNDHVLNRVSEEKAVETCHNKIHASV